MATEDEWGLAELEQVKLECGPDIEELGRESRALALKILTVTHPRLARELLGLWTELYDI